MSGEQVDRRGFMKRALLASAGTTAALSLEEEILLAAAQKPAAGPSGGTSPAAMPMGKIGKLKISRLICGGNLTSGFAHSRDLVYVSSLLRHYFTDEKVFETWRICEECGINTAILRLDDTVLRLLSTYRGERGGKLQWITQIKTKDNRLTSDAKKAIDNGAVGVYVQGGVGDRLVKEGKLDVLAEFVEFARKSGVIGGIGSHSLDVPVACEKAGIEPDFYMKTLHGTKYWSHRLDDVHDNVWSRTPEKTIAFMRKVRRPWIAFKVLAAGAISPTIGFKHAFTGGADFACVGMFDFQVKEDAQIIQGLFARGIKRRRPWLG